MNLFINLFCSFINSHLLIRFIFIKLIINYLKVHLLIFTFIQILGMILVGVALYMRLDKHTDHLVRSTFTTEYSKEEVRKNNL